MKPINVYDKPFKRKLGLGNANGQPAGYKRLIDAGAADVYLIDPGRAEGITGYKKVMELTADANLYFNAHSWSSAINTAAALHCTATGYNYIIFELKPVPSPLQYEFVKEPFEQKNGYVEVPDKPGLGLEIVEERYRNIYLIHFENKPKTNGG